MAKTRTLTLKNVRASDIDIQDALKLLRKKFPKAKVAKLEVDNHNQYVAHIVVAEFPPKDDGGDEGGGDAPEFTEEGPEDSGDDGGDEGGPPPEPKSEGGEKGGGKLMALVEQIAQAVGVTPDGGDEMGMDPMGGPPGPPGGLGPDLPDVGAPSKMEAPLPPPASKPAPGMGGGGTFAKRTTTVWREDDGTPVAEVLKEAQAFFPGQRVAKIERHMGKGANGYSGPVLVCALVRE